MKTPGTPNAGISKFQFTSGKTHRLRLVNSGAAGLQRFTIDNHQMMVVANDFVPVEPYQTNVVTLGVRMESKLTYGIGLTDVPGWSANRRPSDCKPCSQFCRVYAF